MELLFKITTFKLLLFLPLLINNQTIDEILNGFYTTFTQAQITQKGLFYENKIKQIYNITTPEEISHFYYSRKKLINYQLAYPNSSYYSINIKVTLVILLFKINPCRDSFKYCCESRKKCGHDNTSIYNVGDLEIAMTINNFIFNCINEFNNIPCGTFFEIHKRGDEKILLEKKIELNLISGYKTSFLYIKDFICAGKYEVKY